MSTCVDALRFFSMGPSMGLLSITIFTCVKVHMRKVCARAMVSMQEPDLASRVLAIHSCFSLRYSQPNCMAVFRLCIVLTDVDTYISHHT